MIKLKNKSNIKNIAKKLYKDTYYNLEKGQPNQNRLNERKK